MTQNPARRLALALTLALLGAALPAAHAGEIKAYDAATFDQLTHAGKPVLLDVSAPWCPTCRAQKPIISDLMAQPAYRDVTTLTIDFDTAKPLLAKLQVGAQSTLIAYRGEREVGRSVGDTTRAGIEALVQKTVR